MKQILLLAFIVIAAQQTQAQITAAANGLSTTTTSTDVTVKLGGTLENAATTIDFGSGNSSSNLLIKKGSTNYFHIANGGNIGIGTVSPAYKLHVENAGTVAKFRETTGTGTALILDAYNDINKEWLAFKTNNETYTYGSVRVAPYAINYAADYNIQFSPGSTGAGNGNAAVVVGYNEYAGDIPYRLGVMPGVTNQVGLNITGRPGQTANLQTWSTYTSGGDGSSQLAYTIKSVVNANGNFGIGNTAPSEKLHVTGKFRLVDSTQGAGKVLTSDANGVASWVTPSGGGGGGLWTDGGSGNIYLTTSTNKVGIGTSTPSSQLDITGFFRSTGLAGVPSTGTGIEIFYHNGGQDKSFIQSYSRSAGIFKGMDIEGSFIRLNATSGGNVGIGTASPSYKLDITGSQRILGGIGIGTAPTANGITIDGSSSYLGGYGLQLTGNVNGFNCIRTDNTNPGYNSAAGYLMLNNANYVGFVRMDGTGAGGVGAYPGQLNIQSQQSGIRYTAYGATTGNPSHIFYTDYPATFERLRIDHDGATVSNGALVSPLYLGGRTTTSSLVLQSTSAAGTTGADIRLLVGNNGATEAMRILNNSHVLIGTTTDATGYKLAVGGNIIAEKVKVKLLSSGWPDYVFHQDYQLPSLSEVEQFIKTNSHLPGVASAAEVEKEGLDLGDGQSVLLKKIEELTLYVIDINKKVEKLEAENMQMKKELKRK